MAFIPQIVLDRVYHYMRGFYLSFWLLVGKSSFQDIVPYVHVPTVQVRATSEHVGFTLRRTFRGQEGARPMVRHLN